MSEPASPLPEYIPEANYSLAGIYCYPDASYVVVRADGAKRVLGPASTPEDLDQLLAGFLPPELLPPQKPAGLVAVATSWVKSRLTWR